MLLHSVPPSHNTSPTPQLCLGTVDNVMTVMATITHTHTQVLKCPAGALRVIEMLSV